MAVQLPAFNNLPQAAIADEANPTHAEIVTFRGLMEPWKDSTVANLTVFNPNHGFVTPFPNNPAVAADQAARATRLTELRAYGNGLFPIYAAAYARFASALAAGNQAPAPVVASIRPPKTQLPAPFQGKSTAAARVFIRECVNYRVLCPFTNDEFAIRWALQLLEASAAPWKNEQLDLYAARPLALHLTDWDRFVTAFVARWTDPHEGDKAMDRILQAQVRQKTSVKLYNDAFNELLVLTPLDDTNLAVHRSYETGLKQEVRTTALIPLRQDPHMTLQEKQMLMVDIDEALMQTRAVNPQQRPQQRFVVNNPVINLPTTPIIPATQGSRATTVPRGQTPIKVEVARQVTRLTQEEREHLQRTGGCYRCRLPGHMASQCPRNAQVAATTAAPAPAAPTPAEPATTPSVSIESCSDLDFQ